MPSRFFACTHHANILTLRRTLLAAALLVSATIARPRRTQLYIHDDGDTVAQVDVRSVLIRMMVSV